MLNPHAPCIAADLQRATSSSLQGRIGHSRWSERLSVATLLYLFSSAFFGRSEIFGSMQKARVHPFTVFHVVPSVPLTPPNSSAKQFLRFSAAIFFENAKHCFVVSKRERENQPTDRLAAGVAVRVGVDSTFQSITGMRRHTCRHSRPPFNLTK